MKYSRIKQLQDKESISRLEALVDVEQDIQVIKKNSNLITEINLEISRLDKILSDIIILKKIEKNLKKKKDSLENCVSILSAIKQEIEASTIVLPTINSENTTIQTDLNTVNINNDNNNSSRLSDFS